MPLEYKRRLLIAIAKLLGLNSTEASPLGSVLRCEAWLLDEILTSIFPTKAEFRLDYEKFNRLMLNCGRPLATQQFFDFYFAKVDSIERFETAVDEYRKHAMWLFGNFKFAYRSIATSDAAKFSSLTSKVMPKSSAAYERRDECSDIETIQEADLPLLGYVSGQELKDLDFSIEAAKFLLENFSELEAALGKFGAEKQGRLSTVVGKYSLILPSVGRSGVTRELLELVVTRLQSVATPLRDRLQQAREIGLRNTARYLTLPHLDVYVATSMRTPDDFISQHRFITQVFGHETVTPLNLRYFDPTLSFVDDRITKGVIECLMLRRASVTIYNAGSEDTMGKDSELAATLAQGKPVIVYVPTGSDKLDRRANIFRVDHPLGLQVALKTGVAHGIIVVRSAEQCARMLRSVVLHTLSLSIRHEGGNYLLEENETHSVVRVVSDDALLTHAFWTYFHETSQ